MVRSSRYAWIAFCLAAVAATAGAQVRNERGAPPGPGPHRDAGRAPGPRHGGEPGRGPGAWRGEPGRAPGIHPGMERGHGPGFAPHPGPGRGDHGWRGDIRHFGGHDANRWRQGRWYHGAHGGRSGWWWIVGPSWYFYLAPVYPYPDPYLPPGLAGVPPPPGTAPRYWYYCADPPGYYPYVAWCRVGWRAVAAYPPG